MSKPRLESKVALITGAASGIGEAAARLFVEQGAYVVIADVQDELGRHVVDSIGPHRSSYIHCDVRDEKQVEDAVKHAIATYGGLHVLFSNAGVMGPLTSILEMDLQEFHHTMAVNVMGVATTIKYAARVMVERKIRGSIICTTSVTASVGGVGPHSYCASKHALLGIVRSAASELGKYGIRVNCVAPYAVATPLSCGLNNTDPSELEAGSCAMSNLKGVVLKSIHVAEAAMFLASEESAFISGHNLVVDGGFTVVNHSFSIYK
ncbi:short-chain dehydrogenase reductase 3b-like [Aristolochia californica]|uniref:short-chain dehydrogenase reductase 3b-like n=1 Tax=Aristolochia californica TaxID=171875 RepID=UPI0035DAAB54